MGRLLRRELKQVSIGDGTLLELTAAEDSTGACWSPEGSHIVYTEEDSTTRGDIWMLSMDAQRRPRALIKTTFDERRPWLSPDGCRFCSTRPADGRSAGRATGASCFTGTATP